MTRLPRKSGIQDAQMRLTGLAAPRSICNLINPSVISSAHEDGLIFVFFHVDRAGLGRKAVNMVTSVSRSGRKVHGYEKSPVEVVLCFVPTFSSKQRVLHAYSRQLAGSEPSVNIGIRITLWPAISCQIFGKETPQYKTEPRSCVRSF